MDNGIDKVRYWLLEVKILTFVRDQTLKWDSQMFESYPNVESLMLEVRTFACNPRSERSMLDAQMFEYLLYATVDHILESTTRVWYVCQKVYQTFDHGPSNVRLNLNSLGNTVHW
jgi:hypothetical protein